MFGQKVFSKKRIVNILLNRGIDKKIINKIKTRKMKNWRYCKHNNPDGTFALSAHQVDSSLCKLSAHKGF